MSHRNSIFRVLFLMIYLTIPGRYLFSQEKISDHPPTQESQKSKTEESSEQTEFEQLLEKELDKDTDKKVDSPHESTNWFYQIFKTIIGLGFIITILYLFRKYMIFKNSFGNVQTGIITLLHEYPVSTGKKLQIIEVGNRLLLIGVSDAGIQLITEFKEKLPIDQIKLSVETFGKTETRDFWIEISKGITNKVQDWLFRKKNSNKFETDQTQSWKGLQQNARLKIQEMREKKKIFDELDNSHDDKIK